MRIYEALFIIKPDVLEEETDQRLEALKNHLTGMGATTPGIAAGLPGPANPWAMVEDVPTVTLGGYGLQFTYAGMAPGEVGVYQIDAFVPYGVPLGLDVPLTVFQGSGSTTVDERVVN